GHHGDGGAEHGPGASRHGAGHAVPSRSVRLPSNRLTGVQNRDVEFAEIAWAFFKERLATR
ncbi:MAG: hypothetical protein ACO26F_09555, partial [Burkholderiaceae bacterium]